MSPLNDDCPAVHSSRRKRLSARKLFFNWWENAAFPGLKRGSNQVEDSSRHMSVVPSSRKAICDFDENHGYERE